MREEKAKLMQAGAPFVFTRRYDCTPFRVHFGALAEQLCKVARFAVMDPEGGWRLVRYEEFKRQRPQVACKYGVLELLAQGASVDYASESGLFEGFDVFCMPNFLERGNASCLFSGGYYDYHYH